MTRIQQVAAQFTQEQAMGTVAEAEDGRDGAGKRLHQAPVDLGIEPVQQRGQEGDQVLPHLLGHLH